MITKPTDPIGLMVWRLLSRFVSADAGLLGMKIGQSNNAHPALKTATKAATVQRQRKASHDPKGRSRTIIRAL
jgi:hypothetical protein